MRLSILCVAIIFTFAIVSFFWNSSTYLPNEIVILLPTSVMEDSR